MQSSRDRSDRRTAARSSYPMQSDAASASSMSVLPPLFAAKPAQHSARGVGGYTPRVPASARKAALPHLQQQHQQLRESSFLSKSARGASSNSSGSSSGGARMIASGGALSSSGRKIASGAAAGNGAANKNVTRPAALSDEATIGPDGLVQFGPNLSLLMSSLALRFDDHDLGVEYGGGGGEGGGGGGSGEVGEDGKPTALQSSRRRAAHKKKEWRAMSDLYSKAMEHKQTVRDNTVAAAGAAAAQQQQQQQWFSARFNYPISYEPQQPAQSLFSSTRGAAATTAASPSSRSPSSSHAHPLHSSASASVNSGGSAAAAAASVRLSSLPRDSRTHAAFSTSGTIDSARLDGSVPEEKEEEEQEASGL